MLKKILIALAVIFLVLVIVVALQPSEFRIERTAAISAPAQRLALLTGYLGGATASHVRIGEPFVMAIVMGVLVWGGLYLRDGRLRALIPLRR